jgi:hypothetical protein
VTAGAPDDFAEACDVPARAAGTAARKAVLSR